MSSKKYNMTVESVNRWAEHELQHVGYLLGVEDPDIQYAYAQSVVNGMLHLRDALFEQVMDPKNNNCKGDLLKTHDKVVRTIKHLIKDYKVKISEIKRFNSHHVLGNLAYLKRRTRKTRQTQRNRK